MSDAITVLQEQCEVNGFSIGQELLSAIQNDACEQACLNVVPSSWTQKSDPEKSFFMPCLPNEPFSISPQGKKRKRERVGK